MLKNCHYAMPVFQRVLEGRPAPGERHPWHYRVHQFDKIEMFSFCKPEKAEEEHEFILSIEEEIMRELGFCYQVVNICGGDLGNPAPKNTILKFGFRHRENSANSQVVPIAPIIRRATQIFVTEKARKIGISIRLTAPL